jgi:hypothetical protein
VEVLVVEMGHGLTEKIEELFNFAPIFTSCATQYHYAVSL